MKRILFLLTIACLALCSGAAALAQATPGPARARLDAFAKDLHALSGQFSQTLTDASGKTGPASTGTVVLEAPRQFRWETLAPYKQTIVADGSRVWLYDPDLEQVTVRVQSSEESHSPLTVLTDLKQLDRDFKVTEQGQRDGLAWLRLASNAKEPQFDYADLGFDASGLARMVFRDQLGATTEIRFSGWQRNPPVAPATFNFTPPPGADVVGDAPVLTTRPVKD
jgi:outer membrane lipoprotein carrier protein